MKITDPIADLVTRIRNAARARKNLVRVPFSKLKHSICVVMQENGYIDNVSAVGEGVTKELVIELKDASQNIHLRSMSTPGQRIYVKCTEIPRVLDGLGLAILSTPKGVMSGQKAKKERVGGEYLCEVY